MFWFGMFLALATAAWAQEGLTPRQRRIEHERQRLSAANSEDRRDALMKLGAINHPEAARAAITGLNDPEPIVRVTAAHAVRALPGNEAVSLLAPLTTEKLEFVRREAASALGETRHRSAVTTLSGLLADKEPSVRAAAAIAMGQIRDESAVTALAQVLSGTNKKKQEDEFVMRAAADALGEIGSRAGAPVLISLLGNEMTPVDVQRAAARSLGLIGDPAARPALQGALSAADPYLAEAAREALRRLRANGN
jgi:HEAT repeat protein